MSRATPMSDNDREAAYRVQGPEQMTPAQRRRYVTKQRARSRGTARHGRLRRRYDRKDIRQVRAAARAAVSRIRARRGF